MEYMLLVNIFIIPAVICLLYKIIAGKKWSLFEMICNIIVSVTLCCAFMTFVQFLSGILGNRTETTAIGYSVMELIVGAVFIFAAVLIFKNLRWDIVAENTERLSVRDKLCFAINIVLSCAALLLLTVCLWMKENYNINLSELIFTLTNPLNGANTDVVGQAFADCWIFYLIICIVTIAVHLFFVGCKIRGYLKFETGKKLKRISLNRGLSGLLSIVIIILTFYRADAQYGVINYVQSRNTQTEVYEDYYVYPDEVSIADDGQNRNLIYIYLESMETTYASEKEGGIHAVNYIPYLSQLAAEEVNFSDDEKLGGFQELEKTSWTMASLFATTSGLPYAFPTGLENISKFEYFAKGTTTLMDVLADKGYNQMFICGSDITFGGREVYYKTHGNPEIIDYYEAINRGYVPQGYYKNWGYEDHTLYEIAKQQLIQLSEKEEPFNLMMLTVDTHFPEGWICEICTGEYETNAENAISCADYQIGEFINWCKEQDFYENTTIVITGDHLRMDLCMVADVPENERTVYTAFVNADVEGEYSKTRTYTALDMFPSVLAAMGYEIEGEKLGLGVNIFSDVPTLAEEKGVGWLDSQFERRSDYYIDNFS